MIFSSLEFIFLFLPIVIFLYYACIYFQWNKISYISLLASSLFYYAYWYSPYIYIIIISILFNYLCGITIHNIEVKYKKCTFIIAVFVNVAALCIFKYTDFILYNINFITNNNIDALNILLPIGISFFTFQQIAYLSDIYTSCAYGSTNKRRPMWGDFVNYSLFVSFFPQLVAGPIVHHAEMMPQFADAKNKKIHWNNVYWGMVLFSMGLAKKILLADNINPLVIEAFDNSTSLTFMEAFVASFAYSAQLYFDFSGYSDMAVGIGLFFNIKLPFNFNSPYKAKNIQDFWRRWHITLSRWLRDYVYIPLGGNKGNNTHTLRNIFLTFLLGGLWHGAAWTLVLWGVMHGLCMLLHRLWAKSGKRFITLPEFSVSFKNQTHKITAFVHLPAILCTFLFVNFAWIFFRAPNFERARIFMDAFAFNNGFWFKDAFFNGLDTAQYAILLPAFLIIFLLKNSKELYDKAIPSVALTLQSIILFLLSIVWVGYLTIYFPEIADGEFIYFQF